MGSSTGTLVIATKWRVKYRFCVAVMLLFYILYINYLHPELSGASVAPNL
jgi:hypothetical protein